MRFLKGLSFLPVILTILFLGGQANAQSDRGIEARIFGMGQPHSSQDLPAGKLRDRLESLPPQARAKGLRRLQEFSFPEADVETLDIDDTGNIFYADTLLPDPELAAEALATTPTLPADVPATTLDDAFVLHSRPGSENVVFLDFDGATVSGTAWNGTIPTFNALPYSTDADGTTFSTSEKTRIVDIWHRVSEDLAPYDIDVTTEEPQVFTPTTGHVVITRHTDANNQVITCTSCGGTAYVNVFGQSTYNNFSPAWVYFDMLGGGFEAYVAEAASHEFGHNLGLSHDGDTSGNAYYAGHGTGLVSWAPIMGNSYYNNVTQWSRGDYAGANQTQDDMAIIGSKLGYVPDDHGDNTATAAPLVIEADGSVVSSNPELDPHNLLTQNKGVIGSSSDVDVFLFTASAGAVDLTVRPAWDAFYRLTSFRGANLDIEAELLDTNGNTIAFSDPEDDTGATLTVSVEAGTYYLLITGRGNAITPYSDYDSLGQYFINGSVPPGSGTHIAPVAGFTFASTDLITSFVDTSIDADGSVTACSWEFGDGASSAVQNPTHTYADSGTYAVVLTVTDNDGATDTLTQQVTVTGADDQPPTMPAFLQVGVVTLSTINISWSTSTDNVAVTAYEVFRDGVSFTNLTGTSYSDTGLSSGEAHQYQICAMDAAGNQSLLTDPVTGTTNVAPTAGFTFSSEYLVTSFIDTSTDSDGSLTTWSWSFGDGNSSTLQNPAHTYAANGIYTVVLTGTDNNGATNSSSQLVEVTAFVDTEAPTQPANLHAGSVTVSSIDISWNVSTDNVGVTTYEIFRGGASLTLVSGSGYSDTGLTAGTTYQYQVRARDEAGNFSSLSPAVQITTDATSADVITLIDAEYKANRDEFKVTATSSAQPDVTLEVVGFGPMTFKNGKYEYRLKPVGSVMIPSTVDIVSSLGAVLTVPVVGAPTPAVPGQATSPVPGNGQVDVPVNASLDWTAGASTDTHVVYFGTNPNPPQVSSGQSGTSYEPGMLNELTTYYWRVDEVNGLGTTTGTTWSFTTRDATRADTVVISKAEWQARKQVLTVEGTSGGAPDAVLTVEGFGQMTYNSRKNIYTFVQRPVNSNPGTVTVTSSLGGSTSMYVRQR